MVLFRSALLLACSCWWADAFSPVLHHSFPRPTATRLPALIYTSGNDESSRVPDDTGGFYNSFLAPENEGTPHRQVADSLEMASLVRLAAAFAPPEHALQVQDIERVNILALEDTHLDLEVVLCEHHGCLTVSVPINFPTPCYDTTLLKECVLGHVSALDLEAIKVVEALRQDESNAEQNSAVARHVSELRDASQLEYPNWWLRPVGDDLVQECGFLLHLLNEKEFSQEIQELATLTTQRRLGDDSIRFEQAAVSAIGPAGLILRASYREEGFLATTLEVVQVNVEFGRRASCIEDLREFVLAVVETS